MSIMEKAQKLREDMRIAASETYMEMAVYDDFVDRMLHYAYQYVSVVSYDGREGYYIKPTHRTLGWYYIRHSQSYDAKVTHTTHTASENIVSVGTTDTNSAYAAEIDEEE